MNSPRAARRKKVYSDMPTEILVFMWFCFCYEWGVHCTDECDKAVERPDNYVE